MGTSIRMSSRGLPLPTSSPSSPREPPTSSRLTYNRLSSSLSRLLLTPGLNTRPTPKSTSSRRTTTPSASTPTRRPSTRPRLRERATAMPPSTSSSTSHLQVLENIHLLVLEHTHTYPAVFGLP